MLNEIDRLIALPKVQEIIGDVSETTIWRMRRNKQFPEPVSISPNRKAWRESDVRAWLNSRSAAAPQPIAA
jgi:predicted DNA-binding transcriptional regulator AlpA